MSQLKNENKLNKNGDKRGMHSNSQKNIKSANNHHPGRQPKDQSLIEYIRQQLPKTCPYDTNGRTWLESLCDAELRMSLTDTPARRDLFDRLLGRAPEQIEIGHSDITLRVVYDNSK